MRSLLFAFAFVLAVLVAPASASAAVERTFPAGSLIIPMDVDYQDNGMLKAFGLVDALLKVGIPVNWAIEPTKALYPSAPDFGEVRMSSVDFTASARDVESGAVITSHGYRGGPFVIDAAYHDAAMSIVNAWEFPPLHAGPANVHRASADFQAPVARVLVETPRIAVLANGNEDIISGYLRAAGIRNQDGNPWPAASGVAAPGLLTPADVAGPTTTDHRDGALFDDAGKPAYNQLLAPTWGAARDETTTEAIAEIAEFLKHRTHLLASNSAVIWIEDSTVGHFLTTDNGTGEPVGTVACASATTPNNGLCVTTQPSSVSIFNAGLVFAQFDGTFATVGGSVPAYGLAPGSTYRDPGLVMIRDAAATGSGVRDVWLTGYAGGSCEIASSNSETAECASVGKVSYLGGHAYDTNMPISGSPNAQGVRLFLNSLFEAGSIAPPSPSPPPPAAVVDTTAPAVSLVIKARQKLLTALRKGLRATVGCSEACTMQAKLLIAKKLARKLKLPTVVGKATKNLAAAGTTNLVVKFTAKAKRKLAKLRSVRVTLELLAADPAGNAAKARKAITLKR